MLGSSVVGLVRVVGGRVLGLVVVWLLVLGGGSAWATPGHGFVGEFGGFGGGDGQFGEFNGAGPSGLAVVGSSGDVVTADYGQGALRVQRFGADGVFEDRFAVGSPYNILGAVAVDAGGGVYVSANRDPGVGVVVKYDPAGTWLYELDPGSDTAINTPLNGGVTSVAVDPVDGTVYVAASGLSGPVVARFDGSTGALIDSFDGSNGSPDGGVQCLGGLAVDEAQRVYVLDGCKGRVDRYTSAGLFDGTVDDGSRGLPRAVAVDPVSDEVYVAESNLQVGLQVTHFSAGGAGVIYTFDAGEASDFRALAVSGAGTVYGSDAARAFVLRFTRFAGPTVVTGATSSLEARSVVLEGTIDPEGTASSYHFEYGTDVTYGQRTPEIDVGAGSGAVAVSALVEGLQPNLAYHYRLVGSNDAGSIYGADQPLMTLTAPPVVEGPAFGSAITPRAARLHGTVNPSNGSALVSFEYGTTTAYGSSVSAVGFFFSGGIDLGVVADIAGLEPATTYHFRVAASPSFFDPPVYGADQTFVTAPAASGGASGVSTRRATLTGTVDPHGVATSYHFNYGVTSSYGSSTPEVAGVSGDGERLVSQEIDGLEPDRTYHVQVVATDADGVIRSGGDGLFRTAPAPTAEVTGPTGVSSDAATLVGEVNTFGATGSYRFDVWSLDSPYRVSSAERAVAGNVSLERVSVPVAGLPVGEWLVVQLTVTSNDSIGVSDTLRFATVTPPRDFVPAPPDYGCGAAPALNPHNARVVPGQTIALTGQGLGVGGRVSLSGRPLESSGWSATGLKVLIPDEAETGSLTVDCGRSSNAIPITVTRAPDNRIAIVGRSISGSKATVRVRVPGSGRLQVAATKTLKAARTTVTRQGTATITIALTTNATKALRRSASGHKTVSARVRFTPTDGRTAIKTVTITYKRTNPR